MSWLTRLMRSVFPPVTGLPVDEPNPISVDAPPNPAPIVRAMELLVGSEAVLYWEGPADSVLAAWLRRQAGEPRASVSAGINPVSDFYHVQLGPGVLEELAARLELAKEVPSRVRFQISEEGRFVLQWRQAFRGGPILVSRRIAPERLAAFLQAIGSG